MKKLITLIPLVLLVGCATRQYTCTTKEGAIIEASELMFFWDDDMTGFAYDHPNGTLKVEKRKTKTDGGAITVMASLIEKLIAAGYTGGASAVPAAILK